CLLQLLQFSLLPISLLSSSSRSFLSTATATPQIYTLSLHDALPISQPRPALPRGRGTGHAGRAGPAGEVHERGVGADRPRSGGRSEEHTSELQSRFDLVCRLLLEKKKKTKTEQNSK